MKQVFGTLFVLSVAFAVINPVEAPLWGRVLLPVAILLLQSLVIGKGMEVSHQLQAKLHPTQSAPSELEGSCRWTVFEDESWLLRITIDGLSKEMAFTDGVREDFSFSLGGEKRDVRWSRSEMSTTERYRFEASLEGKNDLPNEEDNLSILRRDEPILTGTVRFQSS